MTAARKAKQALHTKRLLRLADILTKVPKDKFDMETWGIHKGKHKPQEHNYCGTSACALGWAAMDKKFQADGLKMRWSIIDLSDEFNDREHWRAEVTYRRCDGDLAGAKFFGLSYTEAATLFLDTEQTRAQVITRLRKYAKTRHELVCLEKKSECWECPN